MRRTLITPGLAALLSVALLAAGCPVEYESAALRANPVDLDCADACAELHDDCTSAQVASTFLLIPAYIIAIAGALVLIGGAGGGSGCGNTGCGNGDFGSGVSCKDARVDCLRSCPLAAQSAPRPAPTPNYSPGPAPGVAP